MFKLQILVSFMKTCIVSFPIHIRTNSTNTFEYSAASRCYSAAEPPQSIVLHAHVFILLPSFHTKIACMRYIKKNTSMIEIM